MAYSKEHGEYLNKIISLGDGDKLEELNLIMAKIKTDKKLSSDDRHNLYYYACGHYYGMGYSDIALHYSNDYVLNLIKAEDELPYESKEREVYLFRKIDKYILEDLQNQELSLCNPSKFNDPFDPLVSSIFKLKAEHFQDKKGFLHLIPSLDNVHITCFAQKGDDNIEPYQRTLLWSHYADSHRGICIKIKIPKGFPHTDNCNIKYGRIDDVKYKKEPVPIKKESATYEECFTSKSSEWEYEHEVRLVYFDRNNKDEYIRIPLEDCKITAVYLGFNCTNEDKIEVGKILKKLHDVKFYKMSYDPENIVNLMPKELPLGN